jgi:hypothetical protein
LINVTQFNNLQQIGVSVAQGKSIKDRSKVYFALILASSLAVLAGLIAVVLSRFQIDILISPVSEPSSTSVAPTDETVPPVPFPTPTVTVSLDAKNPLWNPKPKPPLNPTSAILRVSNQTEYPIRLIVMAQKTAGSENASSSNSLYTSPAHWDFAPGEGSTQGLVLSLPEGKLKVQPGDILVAFAQDGSRFYWGPQVVGSTSQPTWNSRVSEWQLILKPQIQ